ncbi:MAG TPA: deoxynucleoside kinase [Thermoanaerobaculia bacterium]|nr:deoxynucleoside kinase [Thermoanaerobaculia bacterium]
MSAALPFRHIAIEGPIGVGKTSLTGLLARQFRGTKILEDAENPFLDDFYKDKRGAAFRTELFFLLSRYDQQKGLAQRDLFTELVIADYSFPKSKIFAYLTLEDSELMIYNRLYDLLLETVPKPDLVIYLQASLDTLMRRIKKRGRNYERAISSSYLQEVSEAYSHYFYRYDETPLLVVNTTEIDFVHTPEHFEQLVEQIRNAQKGTQYYVPLGS